jgi:hypothetical protein
MEILQLAKDTENSLQEIDEEKNPWSRCLFRFPHLS